MKQREKGCLRNFFGSGSAVRDTTKKRGKQKTAHVRSKEKRVASEGSLTPDQQCETQQKRVIYNGGVEQK